MTDFELRWLERKTGVRGMNEHGYYYDETVRVLQYRTKIVYTDYSIMEHSDTIVGSKTIWSEWIDVPVISE